MLNQDSSSYNAKTPGEAEYVLLQPLLTEPVDESSSLRLEEDSDNGISTTQIIPAANDRYPETSNNDPAPVDNTSEFELASRGQVNGAVAVFGVAGFLLGGPILGIIAAAGSAHFAAKKRGKLANFARRWGGRLDQYGKNNDSPENPKGKGPSKQAEREQSAQKKSLMDKITDELLNSAEWAEKTLFHD